jgi:uncharacterized protein with HEPN domain
MTRISYTSSPTNEFIEFSNLMMTKDAVVIFIEINYETSKVIVKDIEEGKPILEFHFSSIDEAKKKARAEVINLGVYINQEIREKGD